MRVSVLICTYNRARLLSQALRSVIVETTEKPSEVVVVNGGGDDADRVVRGFMSHPEVCVKLIKTENDNLATSRSLGLPECQGDIIAMTDDDARVFPDWITRIRQSHVAHRDAGAIGGLVLGVSTDNIITQVADVVTFPRWEGVKKVRTLPGVNISYKGHVARSLGPQDVTLFRGEDVDYNWRVKQLGYDVLFDPSIRVWHYHRATLKGLLHQHYMYGRAYYLVRKKWPEMYCLYPHGIRCGKDVLKSINFVASLFYQPFRSMRQFENKVTALAALPLLSAVGVASRFGVLMQATKERLKREPSIESF